MSTDRQRRAAPLLVVLVGLVPACIPPGVPTWAMHVQPSPVSLEAGTDEIAGQLTQELASRWLRPGHLAPEQIALVAVRQLEQGRLTDAALWLSIASYRYHQQAIQALGGGEAGFSTLPYGVRREVYAKLVVAEIRRFARLGFLDEVNAIRGRLEGRDEKEAALQEQLTTLGKTNAVDREALRDAWSELRPKTNDPAETSRYPALVDAFRVRLRNDAAAEPDDRHPALYLGRTPLPALRQEAFLATNLFFEPMMCAGVADAFPLLRPTVLAALTTKRPQERANAAATLALAPSDETRALLQARLAVETDARVKLVLAYALVHHGDAEQVVPLVTAAQSCKDVGCTLPASLLQWLPTPQKAALDQAPLARIVANKGYEPRARLYAAAALRDIGRERPLDLATVDALVTAAHFKIDEDDRVQLIASEAVQEATALPRAAVVKRLESRDPAPAAHLDVLHPCALLARLAKVSLVDDLPLLKRLMARFGESEGPEPFFLVVAVLNIHGPDAEAVLVDWFLRYKNVQIQIAVGLAGRPGFSRDQVRGLVVRGDARARIVVKAILQDPDALATLVGYLRSPSVQEKFHAAELAGLTGQTAARPYLVPLLDFSDARYYPDDALVRHAAMAAIVRLALMSLKPPAGATVVARPAAPPVGAPEPAAAPPAEPAAAPPAAQ